MINCQVWCPTHGYLWSHRTSVPFVLHQFNCLFVLHLTSSSCTVYMGQRVIRRNLMVESHFFVFGGGAPGHVAEWPTVISSSMSPCGLSLSALDTGDRKGIRPVKSLVWVCWWCWFDWSLARLTVPVVTTTSIILSSNKSQNGDILVPMYRFTMVVLENGH